MRDLTVGEAVKAVVRNGLGCINQALYLVPRFCHNKPTYQLISSRVAPKPRNDAARGRALETRYADGVTALYRLLAATAAKRLGLCPRYPPSTAPAFMSMGVITATRRPLSTSCTSPRAMSRASLRPQPSHAGVHRCTPSGSPRAHETAQWP
jgi:hypothetical protein